MKKKEEKNIKFIINEITKPSFLTSNKILQTYTNMYIRSILKLWSYIMFINKRIFN